MPIVIYYSSILIYSYILHGLYYFSLLPTEEPLIDNFNWFDLLPFVISMIALLIAILFSIKLWMKYVKS